MKSFIREKKIYCGDDYLEVDCIPITQNQLNVNKGKRSKKVAVSCPAQKNLNDKNAKRYFVQSAEANFGQGDLVVHLTYDNDNLPQTLEEAIKIITNYLRRVDYRREKLKLPPLKYMLVTHIGKKSKRIHHHILMNGGLSRDEIEGMWWKVKGTKNKQPIMYGYANTKRLQLNKKGITQLSGYMSKSSVKLEKGSKRWMQSQGLKAPDKQVVDHNGQIKAPESGGDYMVKYSTSLKRPWHRTNDHKYTKKQIEQFAKNPPDVAYWEKQYEGYTLINDDYAYIAEYNEQFGWSLYLKLRRIT